MTETQIKDQLVDYLKEAHAMENNVLRMLDSQIATTEDADMRKDLEHHQKETERQKTRLEHCLAGYGEDASSLKDIAGGGGALLKGLVDIVRSEKPVRNARDAYVTESLEIASYELLERWAEKAGDETTAETARKNRAEEEAMRDKIASNWDTYVDLQVADDDL
jgi:ferritin-like metal-binding protein YciE